ncbi:INO80 complex subunit C-like [Clytia hemisphaerica]|uniref:Vps72/YL1 C-terminal domain-containing protein n=1 Tax=Clytia hemisphaerica TaxID=252671 RepID=A0A7M5UQ76_9CNID|eukprot:TCONS_00012957-protein
MTKRSSSSTSLVSKDDSGKPKKSRQTNISDVQKFPFKNPEFQHSGTVKSGKKKGWKGLKQISSSERSQAPVDAPTYMNIESPPPLKPVRKYSDISGQLAKYTDPETGLYYSSTEEYKQIKRLPTDIVQGYLTLRNASTK